MWKEVFGAWVGGCFEVIKETEMNKTGRRKDDGWEWRESNWNWEHLQAIPLHLLPRLRHLHSHSPLLTPPSLLASPQIDPIPHFQSIHYPTSNPRIP